MSSKLQSEKDERSLLRIIAFTGFTEARLMFPEEIRAAVKAAFREARKLLENGMEWSN